MSYAYYSHVWKHLFSMLILFHSNSILAITYLYPIKIKIHHVPVKIILSYVISLWNFDLILSYGNETHNQIEFEIFYIITILKYLIHVDICVCLYNPGRHESFKNSTISSSNWYFCQGFIWVLKTINLHIQYINYLIVDALRL